MRKTLIFLLISSFIFASSPQFWKKEGISELLKGTLKGVSLDWKGIVFPSDKLTKLPEIREDFIFALEETKDGIYVGTGHQGKLFFIGKDGKVKLIYDAPELDIFAITKGPKGEIYFATSPRGKIYMYSKGKVKEFFDPEERFIWDLKYRKGYIYAVTGKTSAVYKIDLKGSGEKIAEVPDDHIMKMAFSENDFYLATSGKGRVYFLKKTEPRLIWESPYNEVSAIAVWHGKIYAATQGTRKKQEKKSTDSTSDHILSASSSVEVVVVGSSSTETSTSAKTSLGLKGNKRSFVYQIDPDIRKAQIFWTNPDEYISSLTVYNNELFAATGGKKARIYRLVSTEKATLYEEAEGKEIRTLIGASHLFFSTTVPTSIYRVEKRKETQGIYESDVLDAGAIAKWGEIVFLGEGIEVQTRSGNSPVPDKTWEDWSPSVNSGDKILSPPARYLQFRVKFLPQGKFHRISISYLRYNHPPRITNIKIYPPNVVFKAFAKESIKGMADSINNKLTKTDRILTSAGKKIFKKGYRTIMWRAEDPDGDSIVYDIYLKAGNKDILLQKNWKDNYYAFDSTFIPDGEYKIKIIASDIPSNPQQDALKTEKTSSTFLVDNTPPSIELSGEKIPFTVTVKDKGSGVKELRYTKDGINWFILSPQDGICDGKQESFILKEAGVFALRAVDRHGNVKTLPIRR